MRSPRVQSAVVVLLTALGLAASGALLIDYSTPAPVFCAEGGGCDALRQTRFAYPFGLPMPLFGVVGFLVLAVLAVTRGARVRTTNAGVAGAAGLVGLALLTLQALLRHFCPYCAVVDLASVGLAWLALSRRRGGWDPPSGALAALASSLVLAASLAAPFAWASHEASKVPPVIEEELARGPAGQVTVVEFVDFECPFCRELQATLAPILAGRPGRVRLVRKLVPLTRIHPHALDAARAAACADAMGKGEAMAEALFATEVDDLTVEGCARAATRVGLPLEPYRACLESPATEARLRSDRETFDRATRKGDGLPLVFVGRSKLMGAQDEATLVRALAKAGS